MGLACLKYCKSVKLYDVTDTMHLYDVISNKYDYLKPRGTIAMEYDVDTESYILRISLHKFLKETIEMQSDSTMALVGSSSSLNDCSCDSENSDNCSIDTVY